LDNRVQFQLDRLRLVLGSEKLFELLEQAAGAYLDAVSWVSRAGDFEEILHDLLQSVEFLANEGGLLLSSWRFWKRFLQRAELAIDQPESAPDFMCQVRCEPSEMVEHDILLIT